MATEEEIKRWTAKRKSALVLEIIQGKTTVAEASRAYDLPPSEIEDWVEEGKRGMENALRTKPLEVREEYERQLKELQAAYGEPMLELRCQRRLNSDPLIPDSVGVNLTHPGPLTAGIWSSLRPCSFE